MDELYSVETRATLNLHTAIKILSTTTTTTTAKLFEVNRLLSKDQHQRCTDVEEEIQTTNSNQNQSNNINQMFQHHPHLSSCPHSVGGRRVTKMILAKKQRKIFNPTSISIALISYIMFNQSIMLAIMSSGRNYDPASLAANSFSGSANNNNLLGGFRHKSIAVGTQETAKRRSLIGMVSAEPAPEPAASSARSASAGSYRQPPLNGSIFGKRSVNQLTVSGSSNQKQQQQRDTTSSNDQRQHDSTRLDSQHQQTHSQQQYEPFIGANSAGNNGANNKYQQLQQASITATARASLNAGERTSATDYKDIITGIIEDFLALNNESDPDEASVAFCRMIVYECNQMLHTRNKSLARRKRKRIQQNFGAALSL